MGLKLFFDTETTGFVNDRQPPEHESQPHLVQLGCLLTTDAGHELATVELIVRPDGYAIPEPAARVHGITTEIALSCGVPLMVAIAVFTNLRARADEIVAHNFPFDETVLAAAIHRTGRKPTSPGPDLHTCTMRQAGPVMNLPPTDKMRKAGFNKWKPPSLGQAYQHFFGEELVGAHGALVDTRACARVYFELKKLGGVAPGADEVPF